MTIPKIIHYCWFGGGPMKPLALRCMESWKTIGHGYEIRRWDESNSPLSEPCFAQLLRFKKYAFASDFVRAWAAFHGETALWQAESGDARCALSAFRAPRHPDFAF